MGTIKISFILFAVFCVFLSGFAIAAHVITTSSGGTSLNLNDSISNLYNITVNNTDPDATANITQVNITIPSTFRFVLNSNGTNAGVHNFTNTSTVLSWDNNALVINLTFKYFFFNAIASIPGNYNITIITSNITSTSSSNISIRINDSTIPSNITFVSPTPAAGANISQTFIPFNVTAGDNGVIDRIVIRLFNSTNDQINSSNSTSSPLFFNFTNLTDGTYKINASVNDSYGNINNSETRTIVLDTVSPSISLTEQSDTETSLNVSVSITEATSGVSSCATSRGSLSGSGNQRYVFESSLTCGTSYSYGVNCTDFAGNNGTATSSFSTESCGSSSSSSSGGEGADSVSTTSFWTNTFVADDEDLSKKLSVNREISETQRIKLKINGTHYVGVIDLTSTEVTINVTSEPQQGTLKIGESKKFEVTNDTYYDLKVTLNGINGTKANITIDYVYEEVPAPVVSIPEAVTTSETTDSTGNESLLGTKLFNLDIFKNKKIVIPVVSVLVLAAAGLVFYLIRKEKLVKHGLKDRK